MQRKLYREDRGHRLLIHVLQHRVPLHRLNPDHLQLSLYMIGIDRMVLGWDLFRS